MNRQKIAVHTALLFVGFTLCLTTLVAPLSSQAETAIEFKPQMTIPGSEFVAGQGVSTGKDGVSTTTSDLLSQYVIAYFNYGIGIAGILATVILMAAGVLWLSSGGDSKRIGQAKEMIIGSIVGLAILLGAVLILNTVNPGLTRFKSLEITRISKVELDQADGIVDDLKNAPEDMKYGWVCMNSPQQRCTNTNPPTINLNLDICRQNKPDEKPNDCPYGQLWCCGRSESDAIQADIACQGKAEGTACKITMTGLEGEGYCFNNDCKPCKITDQACDGGLNYNYQCKGPAGFCGLKNGGDCNCTAIGTNCTCKKQ